MAVVVKIEKNGGPEVLKIKNVDIKDPPTIVSNIRNKDKSKFDE